MSSSPSVTISSLGKRYGLFENPWQSLATRFSNREPVRSIWALREISLNAEQGDFFGIIGRNGAGKSTLLQILAGTSQPTTGALEIRGRVAALLELGAGFNPDFTGLENAELVSSIYGIGSKVFRKRLPDIEAFAEIGDFIRRPVREYSSGMFARLAFSTAIHVDADILIIDEILGVGDIRFQQKSMRFLRDFRKKGIVFFVSHNEAAILSLCNKAIWLEDGEVAGRGSPKKVVQSYMQALSEQSGGAGHFRQSTGNPDDPPVQGDFSASNLEAGSSEPVTGYDFNRFDETSRPGLIKRVLLASDNGLSLIGGEQIDLEVSFSGQCPGTAEVAFAVRDAFGQIIFSQSTDMGHSLKRPISWSEVIFEFELPFLCSGEYSVDVAVFSRMETGIDCLDLSETAVSFAVSSRHISAGIANLAMKETFLASKNRDTP